MSAARSRLLGSPSIPALLLVGTLATGAAAPVAGQEVRGDTVGPPPRAVLSSLGPGDRLRVTALTAWRVEGRLAAPVEEELVLVQVGTMSKGWRELHP